MLSSLNDFKVCYSFTYYFLFCQLKFQHSNGSVFHPIKEDFIKLGKLHKPSSTDEEAYKVGIEQFVIELNDLKAILENPQIVENSDEIFETAYKLAVEEDLENPYEDACKASTTAF